MNKRQIKKGLCREIDINLRNHCYELQHNLASFISQSDWVVVNIKNIKNINYKTLDITFENGDIYTIKITKRKT